MNNEFEVLWKDMVMALLEKTIKILNQDNWYPNKDLNRTPLEYSSEALPFETVFDLHIIESHMWVYENGTESIYKLFKFDTE